MRGSTRPPLLGGLFPQLYGYEDAFDWKQLENSSQLGYASIRVEPMAPDHDSATGNERPVYPAAAGHGYAFFPAPDCPDHGA